MSQPANQRRLDYKESEQVACRCFGVDSVMEQPGLAMISELATPGGWAKYYIEHHETHDPIFIASAIDAMLTQLVHTQDRSELDTIRRALLIAQNEPWACSEIDHCLEDTGNFPGEAFVVQFLRETVDLDLVKKHVDTLRKPFKEGS